MLDLVTLGHCVIWHVLPLVHPCYVSLIRQPANGSQIVLALIFLGLVTRISHVESMSGYQDVPLPLAISLLPTKVVLPSQIEVFGIVPMTLKLGILDVVVNTL